MLLSRENGPSRNVWIAKEDLCFPHTESVIMKTCLYNFDPLKPHFYMAKLGFTGLNIIFLIFAQNIDCGYSLEPPAKAILTSTHNLCFEQKYENIRFLSKNLQFLEVKFSIYLNRRVFVMRTVTTEDAPV